MTTPSLENIPYGFCHCGCGRLAPIAKRSHKRYGYVKGQPVKFVMGHRVQCARIDFTDAAPFKIEGVYCKLIPLTRGLYAIVDAEDYPLLSQNKWLSWPSRPPKKLLCCED